LETENTIPQPENIASSENVFVMKNTFTDHGNEIDEIISNKPSFLIRWGISIFFLIIMFLLTITWFIQYPDIVTASGFLSSINAPKEIMLHSGGKLIKLFAAEEQQVSKNEVLGYMESTASHDEVIDLSKLLDSISTMADNNRTNGVVGILHMPFNNLGELQTSYQTFAQAFVNFSNYLSNGFFLRKREMLNNDMGYLQKLNSSLHQQKGLLQQDLSLTDTTFKAHEMLKENKVISALDFRNEKSKLLAKEMTIPQISSSIISNESQQNEKRKEIAELENQIQQQKSIFVQALNTFKSQVVDWKKKYLLIAPIDGIVSFSTFLQENQQLRQGQIICFINPGNSNYYVEAVIPQYNFGKVKTGQEVLLKFQAYPYQEFGSVKGRIEFISNAPSDSGYLAKVGLPEGLVTNYKKSVQYRTGLSMQVDIITDKRRLLERFFSSFRNKLR
jgi:multidrug efflux pump subunit AcrA (membrane-fusion protein)